MSAEMLRPKERFLTVWDGAFLILKKVCMVLVSFPASSSTTSRPVIWMFGQMTFLRSHLINGLVKISHG